MRIFLALWYFDRPHDGPEIIDVCSTRERAENALQKRYYDHDASRGGEFWIEEWELDGDYIASAQVYPA